VLAERAKKQADKAAAEQAETDKIKEQKLQAHAARSSADPTQIAQANASRGPVAAPPGVLQQLRGAPPVPTANGTGHQGRHAPRPSSLMLEDVVSEEDDDGEHIAVDVAPSPHGATKATKGTKSGASTKQAAADANSADAAAAGSSSAAAAPSGRPVLTKAASMGIDRRQPMLLSAEDLAAVKERAKAVARQNTKRLNSGLPVGEGEVDAPLDADGNVYRRAAPAQQTKTKAKGRVAAIELPPLPAAAGTTATAAGSSSRPSKNAPVPRVSASSLLLSQAQRQEIAGATVVLDIPSEEAELLQRNVEESFRSPDPQENADVEEMMMQLQPVEEAGDEASDGIGAASSSDEDEEEEEDEGEVAGAPAFASTGQRGHGFGSPKAAAKRPFSTHLQHHAHLSMPAADPLLPLVAAEVHRLRSQLVEEAAQAQQADASLTANNKHASSHNAKRRSNKRNSGGKNDAFDAALAAAAVAKAATAGGSLGSAPLPPKPKAAPSSHRVADSSTAWGPVGINEPSFATPGAEDASPSAMAADSFAAAPSATLASDPSYDGLDSSSSFRHELDDSGEHQLVPAPCPNEQCGRVLELVDTGAPQMYHCPFCGTPFIM
jgi:hypothetical protein